MLRKLNKYAVYLCMRFSTTLIAAGFLFGIITFTSCSVKQQQLLFQQQTATTDTAQINQASSGKGTSDYHIRSQDVLQIRNLQSTKYIVDEAPTSTNVGGSNTPIASQGQTYQVEDDGTVALPVIGHVPIVGLTRAEAQKQWPM